MADDVIAVVGHTRPTQHANSYIGSVTIACVDSVISNMVHGETWQPLLARYVYLWLEPGQGEAREMRGMCGLGR